MAQDSKATVLTGVATSLVTLVLAGILWNQISGVSSSLDAYRVKAAEYRTVATTRLDGLTSRLDTMVTVTADNNTLLRSLNESYGNLNDGAENEKD